MAISKRLRFEILKRDGFACRYCGATAPDVALHVDHVVPESLGGRTEPQNLVAACADCNSGKASTHPDDQAVADVEQAAADWKTAIELAHEEHGRHRREIAHRVDCFDAAWREWRWTDSAGVQHEVDRPGNWQDSLERMMERGISSQELYEFIGVAMRNAKGDRWRYFCGCVWRTIEAIEDRAAEIAKG